MECDVSFLQFISRSLHRVLFSYLELLRRSFVKCVYTVFKCLNEKQVIKRSTFSVLFLPPIHASLYIKQLHQTVFLQSFCPFLE